MNISKEALTAHVNKKLIYHITQKRGKEILCAYHTEKHPIASIQTTIKCILKVLDTQACDMVAMAQEAICFQSFLDFLQNKLANSTRIRMQRIHKGKLYASFIVVSNFHKYANLHTCFIHI